MDNNNQKCNNLSNDFSNPHSLITLKIPSNNVNFFVSLSKCYDLHQFVKVNNLDITMICETKLNRLYKLQFSDYDIVRVDRNLSEKGGGTAILIKSNIPYTQIYHPSSRNNSVIEYSMIQIKLTNKNLFLVTVYVNNIDRNIYIDEINYLCRKLNLS